MEDCLFCKMVEKKIPVAVVYEDDHAFGFLDIHPRSPGHTVLIPKYHARTIIELPEAEVGPLFLAVKHMAGLLTERLGAEGVTIGANQGRASGQEVDHLHVHLMPRWHGDGGGSIQTVVNSAPIRTIEEIQKMITG